MFNIGDIVEIQHDSYYWNEAKGPVVAIDKRYVYADVVLAHSGVLRAYSGFSSKNFKLVEKESSHIPEDWS